MDNKNYLSDRLLAGMIDALIGGILGYVIVTVYAKYKQVTITDEAVYVGVSFIYILFKDIFDGRSIGKRAMKLQVKCFYEPEKEPNFIQLILRNIPLLWFYIELFTIRRSAFNLRFGDTLAKTYVTEYTPLD